AIVAAEESDFAEANPGEAIEESARPGLRKYDPLDLVARSTALTRSDGQITATKQGCEPQANVDASPMPNGIGISGSAVAVGSPDKESAARPRMRKATSFQP